MKPLQTFLAKTFLATTILFSTSGLIPAQESSATAAVAGAEGQIKFIRLEEDKLVFDVQLDQLPLKGASLSILDGQNNVLFEERIGSVSLSRRYKIVRDNIDEITFRISGKTIYFNQSFTINYKIEEKLEVRKVK